MRLCTFWDFNPMAFSFGFITFMISRVITPRMPPSIRVILQSTTSRNTQMNTATTPSEASWMYSMRIVNTLGTSLSTRRNTVGISAFR